MSPGKTIAVLSQAWAGHIPTYHRLYANCFSALGWRVVEIVPPAAPGWVQRVQRQLDRFPSLRGRRAWRLAARQVRAAERAAGVRIDAVFFVFLDQGFLDPGTRADQVDRWFPWPWAGVTNEPSAMRGPVGPYAGREQVVAARNCRAIVVTDDRFVAPSRAAWPGRTVLVMPEVADVSSPAGSRPLQELHAFAAGRRLVGLVGVISAKKNVAAFLEVARRAMTERPDTAFFLAGDFSAQACPGPERRMLAGLLADAPANCRLFPAPLPDGPDFNAWVVACDVVWVAYRGVFFKSNVLTKAAHFGKPVLVSPGQVMAAHTTQFNLGEVVEAEDAPAVLAALGRLLDGPAERRDFAGFAALNAVARLEITAAEVLAALR